MKININSQVKVILTDKGLKCYNSYYKDLYKNFTSDIAIPRSKTAKNRELETELWEIMQIFGPNTYMGMDNFFKNNILELTDLVN